MTARFAHDRRILPAVLAAGGAAVVVCVLSVAGAPGDSGPHAVLPFGSFEFVLVQAVASLPLSIWAAQRLAALVALRRSNLAVYAALVAAALLGLVSSYNAAIAAWCGELSHFQRILTRAGISVLLVLPWSVAACMCDCDTHVFRCRLRASGLARHGLPLALLAAIAIVVPASYLTERTTQLSRSAEDLAKSQRYWQAWRTINLLRELGSDQLVLNTTPAAASDLIARRLNALLDEVRQPLSPDAPTQTRLDRARSLASLDEWDLAQAALGELPLRDPSACLLLASINQQRQQWDASSDNCRQALQLLAAPGRLAIQIDTRALKLQAYDGLISNYCHRRQFGAAEAALREALQVIPDGAADLHFRIGQFYTVADMPREAASHFQQAQDISPGYQSRVRQALEELYQGPAGCILPRTGP